MGFFPVGFRCSPTAVEPALGLFSVPRPRIASQVSVFLSQGLSPHPLLCACVCVPSSLPPSLLPPPSLPPSLPPSSSWDGGMDYVVTSGEQCDTGLLGDTCCTDACQLRSTTMCRCSARLVCICSCEVCVRVLTCVCIVYVCLHVPYNLI